MQSITKAKKSVRVIIVLEHFPAVEKWLIVGNNIRLDGRIILRNRHNRVFSCRLLKVMRNQITCSYRGLPQRRVRVCETVGVDLR
jgi:hypothetical protein